MVFGRKDLSAQRSSGDTLSDKKKGGDCFLGEGDSAVVWVASAVFSQARGKEFHRRPQKGVPRKEGHIPSL